MSCANRLHVIQNHVSKEELDHIDEFCLTSSRSERMEVLASLRREFRALEKEVTEAINKNAIPEKHAECISKLIRVHKNTLKNFSETEKTYPRVTRELMINYRIARDVIESILAGEPIIHHVVEDPQALDVVA